MTPTTRPDAATGADDEPITLTADEARALVSEATAADIRWRALAAANRALNARNAFLETTVQVRDAEIALLKNQAEQTRRDLATALEPDAN